MNNKIRMARIDREAILPKRKHMDDAGLDLFTNENLIIKPYQMSVVGTGIVIDIPKGYVGLILSKSRSNFLLGGGVVDAGYQGEIRIKIANVRSESLEITKGQAVAQLILIPIETPDVQEVPIGELFENVSDRGTEGGIHLPI